MNTDLINQLAHEAKQTADSRAAFNGNFAGMEEDYFVQEFAELIVLECTRVIKEAETKADKEFTYMGDDVPSVVHIMNIKKHFGLK